MNGTVFCLGQVMVDLTMSVAHIPERGGDVFADESGTAVGGEFNVIYAVRQWGGRAVYAGALGQGPFADQAREALGGVGAETTGLVVPDLDQGYSVAMTEPDGERTFVSTRGAETRVPAEAWAAVDAGAGKRDVIALGGYALAHGDNREAVLRLARARAAHPDRAGARVVFDASPIIGDVPDEALSAIVDMRPLWTVNEREARILVDRLGVETADSDSERCSALARALAATVVVRVGPGGCWTADGTAGAGVARAVHIPAPTVEAVDTNGAGDAHCGVLSAALAEGVELNRALTLANIAGAVTVTRRGPATCPSRDEIEALETSL